jgi:hypothetical protein
MSTETINGAKGKGNFKGRFAERGGFEYQGNALRR